jgi:hypothetical protein
MKKIIATVALVCVVAAGAFAQTDGMLNIKEYSKLFLSTGGRLDRPYLRAATDEDYEKFIALGGSEISVDTPLEIALLSTCAGVANVRPAEANRMLGNAKQADQKLGAAVFQEIQVLRFLNASAGSNDTAAVNRHEAVLQYITGRKNVTRTEIEKFYRDNVRSLIAAVVDEEFNKVSFSLRNLAADRTYDTVLIRNPQTGQYTIKYDRASIENDDKTLTASSLEALLAEMRKNTTDFVQSDIDAVRAQAALIPAVYYERNNLRILSIVRDDVVRFYETPNQADYNTLRNTYVDFVQMEINSPASQLFRAVRVSFEKALKNLHPALAEKVMREGR